MAIQAASAISIISVQPNVNGSPGQLTFNGFASPGNNVGISVLGGLATLTYDNNVIVQANNNTAGAPPIVSDGSDYLSVTTGGLAKIVFNNDTAKNFGFQWGSIDSYNTISFLLNGGIQATFTGSNIINPADGNQGLGGSAYVTFGGGLYDEVRFTSSQNSFEIDNVSVSVPDHGATLALLGLGLSGLAFLRQKRLFRA